jgi:hypothetical protein
MLNLKPARYPSQSGPSDPAPITEPINPSNLRGEQRVYLNAPDHFHLLSQSLLRTLHAISEALSIGSVQIPHFIKYEALSKAKREKKMIDGVAVEMLEGDMVEVNGQRYQARLVKDRIYIKYGTVAVWVPIKKEMLIP